MSWFTVGHPIYASISCTIVKFDLDLVNRIPEKRSVIAITVLDLDGTLFHPIPYQHHSIAVPLIWKPLAAGVGNHAVRLHCHPLLELTFLSPG